jgi:hypothetical protein
MASREGSPLGAKPIIRRRRLREEYRWQPSPEFLQRQRHRREVDMLRPLELKGDMLIGLRKITVFADEGGKVVLGLIGVHGTLSLPLTRRTAANLASLLTRSLVEHGSGEEAA